MGGSIGQSSVKAGAPVGVGGNTAGVGCVGVWGGIVDGRGEAVKVGRTTVAVPLGPITAVTAVVFVTMSFSVTTTGP
jgi:hypothetical protein